MFMNDKGQMHAIYETDNLEQAKLVASNNKDVSVVYHNPNVSIPPVLTVKINGRDYTKWNPEYVEYLKSKYPDISDAEISKCIDEAVEEMRQLEASKTEEIEGQNIAEKGRSK